MAHVNDLTATLNDAGEYTGFVKYVDADGNNCSARLDLMLIAHAWRNGVDFDDLADGFGEGLGTMGGDWSGIRDSSEAAVARMLERALNRMLAATDLEWLNDAAAEHEGRDDDPDGGGNRELVTREPAGDNTVRVRRPSTGGAGIIVPAEDWQRSVRPTLDALGLTIKHAGDVDEAEVLAATVDRPTWSVAGHIAAVLRESAKQHRMRCDGAHARFCDRAAGMAEKLAGEIDELEAELDAGEAELVNRDDYVEPCGECNGLEVQCDECGGQGYRWVLASQEWYDRPGVVEGTHRLELVGPIGKPLAYVVVDDYADDRAPVSKTHVELGVAIQDFADRLGCTWGEVRETVMRSFTDIGTLPTVPPSPPAPSPPMSKHDRIMALVRQSGARCTCGWDNGDHEPRCDLNAAWDQAEAEVDDEDYEREQAALDHAIDEGGR